MKTLTFTLFPPSADNALIKIYILVWIPLDKWQCATNYHDTGCFIASQSLHLFCCVPVSRLGAWESYHTLHYSVGKWKRWFLSPNLQQLQKLSRCPHVTPMLTNDTPHRPKKEQTYCYLVCHNHLYPSWWLLLTTTCRLDSRWTWYCHRISGNCTGLPCCSLWFRVQKFVQVAINCLCLTSDPPGMFIIGVWT